METVLKKPKQNENKSGGRKGLMARVIVPWMQEKFIPFQEIHLFNAPDDESQKVIKEFVAERSRVHEEYIKQQGRNKRIALVLAFVLILVAAGVVIFAPVGREKLSYWIGAALLIFAAGASGFGRIWGKTNNFSFGADKDHQKRKSNDNV